MEEGLLRYSYCCADIANIAPCTHSSTKLTSLLHCRPASHFIVCISDLEAGSQHSFLFVIPTHITLRCSFSIFPYPFWDWFSSCFVFEKRASLLHRSMVALDRKDPLGQAATFLSPPSGSPEQALSYLSFPSSNITTASPVKIFHRLSDLISWELFPKFRWYFLCYKFIQLLQVSISNVRIFIIIIIIF